MDQADSTIPCFHDPTAGRRQQPRHPSTPPVPAAAAVATTVVTRGRQTDGGVSMSRQVMVVLLCAAKAFAAVPPTSGPDGHGDPLPPGAVTRLGTMHGRYALTWSDRVQLFFSPDGKEVLTHA